MRKQRGVYSLRSTRARVLCCAALCGVALLLAACVRAVTVEPAGFSGSAYGQPPASGTSDMPGSPGASGAQPPYVVALDAGHGGFDTGADALVQELSVCEQTVDLLYALLDSDPNYFPLRTRPNGEDRSIKDRAQTANDGNAQLLLSIHANSDVTTQQSHGFECFPTPPGRTHSEGAMRFALYIADRMGSAGHRLRGGNGVRFAYYNGKEKQIVDSTDDKVRTQRSFGIVERPDCPAVLVEQCFLTNPDDVAQWTGEAGCARAARIYYEAICAYFGTQPAASAA
ncbi:MAG: N-acetylmuramoyl-L-alanine amidase [Subdoligranulum sp.]|nr:N-acetylmuramoyl-L-alanine amidase [Subdoligranulum sp.]